MKFYHLSAPLLLILPVCTQAADAYVPVDAEPAAVTLSTVTVRGKRQKSLNKGYTASGTYAATGMPLTLREVPRPRGLSGRDLVVAHTRAWAAVMGPLLAEHAVDWHMLQAVFDADLDQRRLARSHAAQEERA